MCLYRATALDGQHSLVIMDARVYAAIGLMNELLADRLTVGMLSRRLNLSSARLRQLFKEETGRPPIQYFRDLRLRQAQKLLSSTFLSVKEITSLCGMNDASHFARDFKKKYGSSPSEYRLEAYRSRGR